MCLCFTSCNHLRFEISLFQEGVSFGVLLLFCDLLEVFSFFHQKIKMASGSAPEGHRSFQDKATPA